MYFISQIIRVDFVMTTLKALQTKQARIIRLAKQQKNKYQ